MAERASPVIELPRRTSPAPRKVGASSLPSVAGLREAPRGRKNSLLFFRGVGWERWPERGGFRRRGATSHWSCSSTCSDDPHPTPRSAWTTYIPCAYHSADGLRLRRLTGTLKGDLGRGTANTPATCNGEYAVEGEPPHRARETSAPPSLDLLSRVAAPDVADDASQAAGRPVQRRRYSESDSPPRGVRGEGDTRRDQGRRIRRQAGRPSPPFGRPCPLCPWKSGF